MRRFGLATALALLTLPALAAPAWAQMGVGVNLGKIEVDEPLTPGGVYHLPSLGVINTGREAGDYEVEITYMHEQTELKPAAEWFRFEPASFPLQPGASQAVAITLTVPMSARPGDYFALIEAHPIVKSSGVAIGVEAATKLYFSVRPANILVAVQARVVTFAQDTAPYSYIGVGIVGFLLVALLFRRYFRIRFRLERRE